MLMLALTEFSERSMLEDEFEREFELVLIIESALSTLEEDSERVRLEA